MHKYIPVLIAILLILVSCKSTNDDTLAIPEDAVARVVYFYAEDCATCQVIYDEILQSLINRCGDSLEFKTIQVNTESGFEVFADAENTLIGDAGRWDIPTIVVEDKYMIGEDAIRSTLLPHLQCVFADGGNAWPEIPSLLALDNVNDLSPADKSFTGGEQGLQECISEEEAAACVSPVPIFALYLTSRDCEPACDRTIYDLRYLQGLYPQMIFEDKAIEENRDIAIALVKEFGMSLPDDQLAPAIVVGSDYLTGDDLTLDNLKTVFSKYRESGALAVWYTLDVD